MLIADETMDVRDLISRQSTSSTVTMLTPGSGNFLEVIHDLYQELEPQICKSYRPNVKYVPGKDPEPKTVVTADESPIVDKTKKQKPLRTAKIVIDAVSELQKRRNSNVAIRSKFKDVARRASMQGIDESLGKGVSQSLPNLTETDS